MSPGTSSRAESSCKLPSRSARTFGTDIFFSAAIACSARYSCTKPSKAYRATMARIAMEFFVSPSKPATTAAPIRIKTIVAVICSHKIWNAVRPPRSISSFAPYLALFSFTCVEVSPVSDDEENSSSAVFVSSMCQFIIFRFSADPKGFHEVPAGGKIFRVCFR